MSCVTTIVTSTASPAASAALRPAPAPLRLLGNWASSYTHRVQLALKLKGLQFEYVEEDLGDKSSSLLHHNPIHKKVPVLLHSGHSIPESTIILEYIDESWPDLHPIMPSDAVERSVIRFWCHFVDSKLGAEIATVFRSSGGEQAGAVKEVRENLGLIERELREGFFKGRRFFGGERIGLLDIVLGCGSYWLSVFETVVDVKLVDEESFPLFSAWLRRFEELEEVKEIIPASERLLEYATALRQMLLGLAAMKLSSVAPPPPTTTTNTTAANPSPTTTTNTTAANPPPTTATNTTAANPSPTTTTNTTAANPSPTTATNTTAANPSPTTTTNTTAANPPPTTATNTTAANPSPTTTTNTTAANPPPPPTAATAAPISCGVPDVNNDVTPADV